MSCRYPANDAAARLEIDTMIGLADDLSEAFHPSYLANANPEALGHHNKDPARTKRMRESFVKNELPK